MEVRIFGFSCGGIFDGFVIIFIVVRVYFILFVNDIFFLFLGEGGVGDFRFDEYLEEDLIFFFL